MTKECKFAEQCTMSPDIIELSGGCDQERGKKCGKIAAYGMLYWQYNQLAELDEAVPILGRFFINCVPAGNIPLEVREQWQGVSAPFREQYGDNSTVEITPADGILSLLSHGKLDAANWLIARGYEEAIDTSEFGAPWVFQASEGVLVAAPRDQTVSSLEHYGAQLDPAYRAAVEAD